MIPKNWLKMLGVGVFLFLLGGVSSYFYLSRLSPSSPMPTPSKDKYAEFLGEVYEVIKTNYWDKVSDEQLSNLARLALEKITAAPQKLPSKDKEGVTKAFLKVTAGLEEKNKKEVAVSLASLVLGNLSPFGRNGLYTRKEETQLKNLVQNINPEKNLYENLGVSKEASPEAIAKAYRKLVTALSPLKESSPAAREKLEKAEYAYKVLGEMGKKSRYDQGGVEPTVFTKLLSPRILHLYLKKFSPTTLEEFQKALSEVNKGESLEALILDLRGNIGGAIDLLPYFLGPFIGQNQYAYEFLHQGETTPSKTQTGWLPSLVRYKRVAILTDGETQSSAELTAAVLKRYNVGILIGEKTKGWGTIEKVFEIREQIDPQEKYSVFLVHTLTLGDDNQPLEGRGVEPVINIREANWEKLLLAYFNDPELVQSVKAVWERGLSEFR